MHCARVNRHRVSDRRHAILPGRGVTLVECLLAMAILAVAVLSLVYTATAGHQHAYHGDTSLRATRLAEQLMEEILSRPYDGSGTDRDDWHLDDYDGFTESAGTLTDGIGSLLPADDQTFSWSVSVSSSVQTIGSLDGIDISGKTIVITVQNETGEVWQLCRFLPEKGAP